jgi:hypothetical protein
MLLVTLPAFGGCYNMDLGFGPDGLDFGGQCLGCDFFELGVERGIPTILVGDTAYMRIWSSIGHERATFAVSGTALRLVSGSQLKTEIKEPATEVRAVGIAAGRDTVRAQAADTVATAKVGLRVVDSASITGLQTWMEPNAKMRVGDTRHLDVYLYVGQEPVYGGPTATVVSNTDVLLAEPVQANPRAIFLKAKAVGTTTLTIRFLQRSQTYRIDVTP